MKYIAYKNQDPNNDLGVDVVLIGINDDQTPEQVLASLDPSLNARIVDDSEFPSNVSHLPYWKWEGNSIVYDLELFREAVRENLRSLRYPLLAQLDVDFMRALENGLDTTAIVAEKNRLRDITNLADTVNTIEELKALRVTP